MTCDKNFSNASAYFGLVTPPCPPLQFADELFVGNALEGGNNTGWEDAVGVGNVVFAHPPSPDGTVPIYNGILAGVPFTVEMIDFDPLGSPSTYTRRNFPVETPVSQGGATVPESGYDQTIGSSLNKNAFLISFDRPLPAWAATFLDLESDPLFESATLVLFDEAETELLNTPITYPSGEDGGGEAHFVGFTRQAADVSHIVVAVGATATMLNPNTNRVAFAQMRMALCER